MSMDARNLHTGFSVTRMQRSINLTNATNNTEKHKKEEENKAMQIVPARETAP